MHAFKLCAANKASLRAHLMQLFALKIHTVYTQSKCTRVLFKRGFKYNKCMAGQTIAILKKNKTLSRVELSQFLIIYTIFIE